MCGEKKGGCATLYWVRGSPPRVQGKVHFLKIGLNERGITPAYAGKRVCPLHRSPWHRDHPRVCGEKPAMMVCSLEYWGSPPRMRGKDKFHTTIQRTVRITPAYAGKRCRSPAFRSMPWDHPRMCGEKCPPGKFFFMTVGSPPRMRGKVNHLLGRGHANGITPAYAGKRIKLRKRHSICGDHPRVCGEKPVTVRCIFLNLGSPPRMRGKVPSSI